MSSPLRCLPVSSVSVALVSLVMVGACSSKSSTAPGTNNDSGSPDGASGPVCPADDDLISDFTTDNGLHPVDGRQGGWYTYGDHSGLGTLMPPEGSTVKPDLTVGNPSCSNGGSLHVKATGFADWGAATGVDFKPKTTTDAGISAKGTYDASKYRGISFWAKAAAPVKFVQVKFTDPYTEIPSVLPMASWCQYMAGAANNCSPYLVKFGYGYTGADLVAVSTDYPKYKATEIGTDWKRFEILFSDTKQDQFNPGIKSPGGHLDVTQLMGMAIQINSDHSTVPPTPNDFEIWIDDIGFVK